MTDTVVILLALILAFLSARLVLVYRPGKQEGSLRMELSFLLSQLVVALLFVLLKDL